MKNEAQQLYDTVIKNGFCIGCGSCSFQEDSPFSVEFDEYGCLVAEFKDKNIISTTKFLQYCPFSSYVDNEDQISENLFNKSTKYHESIGYFKSCYVGHVNSKRIREQGSSGGLGRWLASHLLKKKLVDCVFQVVNINNKKINGKLFEYVPYYDADEVVNSARSAYYPVTMEKLLKQISNTPGRYAVTGLPCFIKAIRLLQKNDPIMQESIVYTIGLVCGSLKSDHFSRMIAWQMNLNPEQVGSIEFRGKYEDRPASHKKTLVYDVVSNLVGVESSKEIFGAEYGMGFFKPKSCDYCDDIVAETADISFGDAWLPEMKLDSKGTSLVIVRNEFISEIIESAIRNKEINLTIISSDSVIHSQSAGIRHRREGLAYRLTKSKKTEFVPTKRVKPRAIGIPKRRRKIYDLRKNISEKSHVVYSEAIKLNDYSYFEKTMTPFVDEYRNLYKIPILEKVYNKLIKLFKL